MKKRFLAAAISAAIASLPMTAAAYQAGDWIVRGGAALVDPDESSSKISVAGLGGAVGGTSVGVDNDTQLGLTFTYMFTSNIGLELLASTPFEHDVTAAGLDAYGVPSGTKIASVKHLPPTLSLEYFFMDANSAWQPYAGIGINYWLVTDKELSSDAKSVLGARKLNVDNSVGLALQLGMDYSINQNWLVNAAIWKIDISTTADFQSAVGKVKADIDIDPWVYMIGVGYKF